MNSRAMKLPSAEHPITIEANPARVVVTVAGRVVADTRDALVLREAAYDPVHIRDHVAFNPDRFDRIEESA